jgi:hypothetical protein
MGMIKMNLRIRIKKYNGSEQIKEIDTEKDQGFDINNILPIGAGIKEWYVEAV